jgi:hypothetical protein
VGLQNTYRFENRILKNIWHKVKINDNKISTKKPSFLNYAIVAEVCMSWDWIVSVDTH